MSDKQPYKKTTVIMYGLRYWFGALRSTVQARKYYQLHRFILAFPRALYFSLRTMSLTSERIEKRGETRVRWDSQARRKRNSK